MWFAAMRPPEHSPWLRVLVERLLSGDAPTLRLLGCNPFPETPPVHVRIRIYRYRFTTKAERRATGDWWHRELLGTYLPPTRLASRR
jgi:hypothetical protein